MGDLADEVHNSCPQCPKTKKAARALSGANERSDRHARATDLLHRVRKHKSRNSACDEECRQGDAEDTRQDEDGRRGCHHVCPFRFSIYLAHRVSRFLVRFWFRTQIRLTYSRREQLREQHELTQEIGNAITSMPITDPIDEDELEADLAALEQENLDEKMLKTGTVPQDSLQRLPTGVNGESKFPRTPCLYA